MGARGPPENMGPNENGKTRQVGGSCSESMGPIEAGAGLKIKKTRSISGPCPGEYGSPPEIGGLGEPSHRQAIELALHLGARSTRPRLARSECP
jgi:hypothetical protein